MANARLTDRQRPRIFLIDWRGRADLLRALLQPTADVIQEIVGDETPDLVLVDPAPGPLTAERWRTAIDRRLGALPCILLGAAAPPQASNVLVLAGELVPSRLLSAVEQLLATHAVHGDGRRRLAELIPLSDEDKTVLHRITHTRLPVVLTGEPGSGRRRLARHLITGPDEPFLAQAFPLQDFPLDSDGPRSGRGSLYLTRLEDITDRCADVLLHILDSTAAPRVLLAGERIPSHVRSDVRLRLESVLFELPVLRLMSHQLPDLFRELVRAIAADHELDPPRGLDAIAHLVSAYAWPQNFEEMVTCATRAVMRAAGRQVRASDLNIPAIEPRSLAAGVPVAPVSGRSLDSLVEELAHEIRNPLVSIKTFTQLLAERFEDPEFRGEYYRVVSDEVNRVDNALKELQECASLHAAELADTELVSLVERVLQAHDFMLRKRHIDLVIDFPIAPVWARTDGQLLTYALEKIVREASAALADGGPLEVSLAAPADGAAVRVAMRYRTEPGVNGDVRQRVRRVVGLRHALAGHVLRTIGGRLEIEDTLAGDCFVSVMLDEPQP